MRIAAYCRVSTDSDEQLDSLENQKLFFSEFAKNNNLKLIKIYADEGISGKQMKNRTEFLQMLNDAKLDIFDMVVVKDISRFARNTVDFLNSIRELKAIGVEVKFLSNNQTILGDSEFILTIFSAMAQEESANLSKRVKFGKKINASKGRVPTKVYGYDRINNFELKPSENEKAVVLKIFDLYVNEGYGASKIAKILNDEKIPTKLNAEAWIPRTIRRILTNPVYIGKLVNNKYEIKDYLTGERIELSESENFIHDRPDFRIISDEIFEAAQEKIDSNRKIYKNEYVHMQGRDSTRHIFSTLIKCEHCGYSFSRKSYTYKKSRTYWLCTGFNIRGSGFCSNNTYIEEHELIAEIKNYLNNMIVDKDVFYNNLLSEFETNTKVNNIDTKKIEKQIKKLNSDKEKYKTMYLNNIIDIDELKANIKICDDKISELEKNIKISQKPLSLKTDAKKLYSQITEILSLETFTNVDLKKIIDKIVVNHDGEVKIYLKQFS